MLVFSHPQGQVELCYAVLYLHRLQAQPGKLQLLHGSVLQDEHHLKQGASAKVPARPQLFDQLFKGQVLVRISSE